MKTEKLLLTALCGLACLWVGRMVAGVAGLALHQGSPAGAAYLEMAAFAAAAALPLAATWWRAARRSWLRAVWALSALYVCFVAANYAMQHPLAGSLRLLLWAAIIVLTFRQAQQEQPV